MLFQALYSLRAPALAFTPQSFGLCCLIFALSQRLKILWWKGMEKKIESQKQPAGFPLS